MSKYTLLTGLLALIVLGFCAYEYRVIWNDLDRDIGIVSKMAADLSEDNILLSKNLKEEKNRNYEFESKINEIAGTVGILDKIAKTDKELLEKYSKVYFLNEHYIPKELSELPLKFSYPEKKQFSIHSKVYPYLENMLQAAERDGVVIKISSAYRSFGEQVGLKSAYTVTYGTGANKFSADQGYSEHQLGTTVDLTTPETGSNFDKFESTEAYKWLLENAHKYGFILSYPKNNAYYQFEPWHWRFVGTNLANRLHGDGIYFYDLDQRTIDLYLVSLFD